MICSRCRSQWPNPSCFVCQESEREEPDAFAAAKEAREESEREEAKP